MDNRSEMKVTAEIYRKVARTMEQCEQYACNAIEEAGLPCSTFYKTFRPTVKTANEAVPLPHRRWTRTEIGGAWGFFWGDDSHNCRVLALCLMAAMVEAGDV